MNADEIKNGLLDWAKLMEKAAEQIETLKRERDAAIEDLKQDRHCTLCKHHLSEGGNCYGVSKCAIKGIKINWEWRGLQEAEEGEME